MDGMFTFMQSAEKFCFRAFDGVCSGPDADFRELFGVEWPVLARRDGRRFDGKSLRGIPDIAGPARLPGPTPLLFLAGLEGVKETRYLAKK
jgi:hypothetical protein